MQEVMKNQRITEKKKESKDCKETPSAKEKVKDTKTYSLFSLLFSTGYAWVGFRHRN